jgi:hypothetical protein
MRAFSFLFLAFVLVLTFAAGSRYEGHWFFYLLFTLLANTLLANGFRKNAIFFDTFIGIFLWLGFWLKFSVRVAFTSGIFHEPVGAFSGSAEAFDKVLMKVAVLIGIGWVLSHAGLPKAVGMPSIS